MRTILCEISMRIQKKVLKNEDLFKTDDRMNKLSVRGKFLMVYSRITKSEEYEKSRCCSDCIIGIIAKQRRITNKKGMCLVMVKLSAKKLDKTYKYVEHVPSMVEKYTR